MSRTAQAKWELDGRSITVSSLDRPLWPDDGLTKQDLLVYYRDIAPVMLPYLRAHPLTLNIFPDGVAGRGHYRRELPKHAPEWLRGARYQPASRPKAILAPLVDDIAGLVWHANQGAIEFHMWLSREDQLNEPDWAVFDLDPGPDVPFARVLEAAQAVRAALEADGLTGYAKTSGGRGLHVFVPLEPVHPFPTVREWVHGLAKHLAEAHPRLIATASGGTHDDPIVTIDHAQNSIARNTAAPYTVRAAPHATVSAPVTWDEVAAGKIRPDHFTLRTMPERLKKHGDLWAPALEERQRLRGV